MVQSGQLYPSLDLCVPRLPFLLQIWFILGLTDVKYEPSLSDSTVRFWCPQLGQEGSWQHIALVFQKAGILKNSSVSLYVNGVHVSSQKVTLLFFSSGARCMNITVAQSQVTCHTISNLPGVPLSLVALYSSH